MNEAYEKKILHAKKNKKLLKKTIVTLQKKRKGDVDKIIHQLHEEAFTKIDCLECANCCITTGPLLNQKDIKRIANHFGITELSFIEKHLRLDEDDDYVFKVMPCPFLGKDNYCSIYELRPKACREYPHTDRVNQLGILKLTEKNALICPAVADIFDALSK
jgi:Fe-S-cluster containining protein